MFWLKACFHPRLQPLLLLTIVDKWKNRVFTASFVGTFTSQPYFAAQHDIPGWIFHMKPFSICSTHAIGLPLCSGTSPRAKAKTGCWEGCQGRCCWGGSEGHCCWVLSEPTERSINSSSINHSLKTGPVLPFSGSRTRNASQNIGLPITYRAPVPYQRPISVRREGSEGYWHESFCKGRFWKKERFKTLDHSGTPISSASFRIG